MPFLFSLYLTGVIGAWTVAVSYALLTKYERTYRLYWFLVFSVVFWPLVASHTICDAALEWSLNDKK